MQYTTELHAEELKWDEGLTTEVIRSLPGANKDPNQPPFDVVLAADCLFFKDFHKALVHTLSQALSCSSVLSSEKAAKPGYVIFINPPRGKTAQLFIEEAQEVLEFSTFAKGQVRYQILCLSWWRISDQRSPLFVPSIFFFFFFFASFPR